MQTHTSDDSRATEVSSNTPIPSFSSMFEKEKEEGNSGEGILKNLEDNQDQLPGIPERSTKDYIPICILCFFVAFGGYVFGYDTGTISGFLNMDDYKQRFGSYKNGEYYFSNVRMGLIVAIFNVGCAFGGIFLSKIGDIYGRRVGIMFSMLVYVIGIIIQISASNKWYQIFIGRLISGLGVGCVSVVSPLFIGETSPKTLRGTLVCCFQLCITLGIFLGYCTTYGTKTSFTDSRTWRIPLGLCFAWAILLITGMVFMPESPRYLIEKIKIEDAKVSLARSNKISPEHPGIYTEIQLIQAGIEREKLAGSASWSELITGKPKIFFRVITGIILQSIQQLTGNNYFFYYGTTIFQAVGLNDSFQTSIILGIVNFASTFIGIFAIEKLGRRRCLMIGSVCMSVCFIIYSVIGSVHLYVDGYDGPTRKPTGNALIFISCFFIFFFASTWAGGVYTIVSEIYPLRIRSKAIAIATAANWTWGFLISFFTPFITSAIHFYYGFVFTGCIIFSFFFVYFCVYETKGLSLEEVDELYASGLVAWKSSSWAPPSSDKMAHTTGYAAETKPEGEHV